MDVHTLKKSSRKTPKPLLGKNQLILKHSMAFNSFQLKQKRELRVCIKEVRGVLRAVRNEAQPLWF